MNAHRMDQETVERLLVGPVVDPVDGPPALVQLLAAVRAAPRPAELGGEAEALRAYRMVQAGSTVPLRAVTAPRTGLAGRLGVRVAAIAVAVTATGGVAFAATGGNLPGPLRHRPDPVPAPTSTPARPTAPAVGPGAPPPATPARSAPATAAPTAGLCRAYRADAGGNPGRALENPAFSGLIASAGGRDRVAGYCDRLLTEHSGRSESAPPGTQRGGNEPTGQPTARPDRPAAGPSTPPGRPASPAVTAPPGPGSH
ncbi:hypothetical protein [Micromonospora mirobrigensis]|uniref:Uncharacterized protein n=1 Tax=Micromonospora mirobrigensis TaxID=262898 RepID=A0A1C4Z6T3_9ACTN|nr:hypothetical protein [Micromonospora mirobrigensis]SCF28663.1 hypothetical protein GA0070564_105132 [Micromonospora mirobrigensis]